jgi:hypothetical protein
MCSLHFQGRIVYQYTTWEKLRYRYTERRTETRAASEPMEWKWGERKYYENR